MKITQPRHLKAALLAIVATMALPALSHAQLLVYSDNFTGTGALNNPSHHPTTSDSTTLYGGSTNATWSTSGTVSLSLLTGARSSGSGTKSAFLSLNVADESLYTLTATVNPALLGKTTIGFANGTSFTDAVLLSGSSSTPSGTRAPQLNGVAFGTNTDVGNQLQPITVTLTLDTRHDEWVTTLTLSGTSGFSDTPWSTSSTYVFDSGDPTITSIGFSSTGNLSFVSDFELQAVPEPSSYALGLIIVGVLAFEIRRRRSVVA